MIDRRKLLLSRLALLSIQMDPDLDTDCALAWAEGLIDCRATRVAEARVSGVLSQSPYVPSPVREAAVEMCQLLSAIATVVYTQGRGSVTVDCADGWRRMVPQRYIRQIAIVRTP